MAFFSSNKLLLEINRNRHPFYSKIIDVFINHPGIFISTLLIGNNIALVVYGLEMSDILIPYINLFITQSLGVLLIQTFVSTAIILLTAEFMPKTLFRIDPVMMLNIFSVPIYFFYIFLYPLSKLTLGTSNFLLRWVLKVPESEVHLTTVLGRLDLNNLLNEHHEKIAKHNSIPQEVKFLKNALDFSSIKIRECTIPRTDIEAIDLSDSLDLLKTKFIESGLSKILVYKETIDNIIGYVHVSEMFKHPKALRSIVAPISVIPETMTANKVLEIFTKEHKSIALVVDEFGGTYGIVTMEDILEEIFGEINDEHDVSDLKEEKISPTEFIFSGRWEIDSINEKHGLKLPYSDEYETLAGFILYHHEDIPQENDIIEIDNFTITILTAANNRIDMVKIEIHQPQ